MINGKTVSLAMVIYNEAEQVEKLVENLRRIPTEIVNMSGNSVESPEKIVDEVVIVDQGSDIEQSKRLQKVATLYHKTLNKGNADYDRQFCYSLCNSDYILALDGDESLTKDNILGLINLVKKYDPDLVWFLFHNGIRFQDKRIDLLSMLGDDPHPRFWRKIVGINGQSIPTVIWPNEAHIFPRINTQAIIYSKLYFEHERELIPVIQRHIHRGRNIDQNGQQMEKKFIDGILNMFGKEVRDYCELHIPELKEYLK